MRKRNLRWNSKTTLRNLIISDHKTSYFFRNDHHYTQANTAINIAAIHDLFSFLFGHLTSSAHPTLWLLGPHLPLAHLATRTNGGSIAYNILSTWEPPMGTKKRCLYPKAHQISSGVSMGLSEFLLTGPGLVYNCACRRRHFTTMTYMSMWGTWSQTHELFMSSQDKINK